MNLSTFEGKLCVVLFERIWRWKWVNLRVKLVRVLTDVIDKKKVLIESK